MGNLPTLYLNVMSGLRTEEGRTAFLWATEHATDDRHCYKAERFAHDVDLLGTWVWGLILMGLAGHGRDPARSLGMCIDLYVFMMRRHAHLCFPGKNEAWI